MNLVTWGGRFFIMLGSLAMVFSASLAMEVFEPIYGPPNDGIVLMLASAVCLGVLLLVVGFALEDAGSADEYEQCRKSSDA